MTRFIVMILFMNRNFQTLIHWNINVNLNVFQPNNLSSHPPTIFLYHYVVIKPHKVAKSLYIYIYINKFEINSQIIQVSHVLVKS